MVRSSLRVAKEVETPARLADGELGLDYRLRQTLVDLSVEFLNSADEV